MLEAILTRRSLRFWIGLGMVCAVVPLGASAVGSYMFLKRGVVAAFEDVAMRRRDEVEPLQRLRLLMWDALVPVDEYVDEGDPRQPAAYRALRAQIEAGFAEVHRGTDGDVEMRTIVERARDDWTAADHLAIDIISLHEPPGEPHVAEFMDQFHGRITAAVDKLGVVYDLVASDLQKDHDLAGLSYARSEWLSGIAAIVSMCAILVGIFVIGRTMRTSVDRLVAGAERFAAGERTHRVEIRVPPELARVAREFNRMIARIHEGEEALADQARRDGLTHLLNRRAFDDALIETFARARRVGEFVALLMIDIDHFKQVNDTYGHATGDEVLRMVARTLVADVRAFEHVFRIGGEEFAVILPGADAVAARATAERLRSAVGAGKVIVQGHELTATVSVGASVASPASDPGALVGSADTALYRAKRAGRNRVDVDGGPAQSPDVRKPPRHSTDGVQRVV